MRGFIVVEILSEVLVAVCDGVALGLKDSYEWGTFFIERTPYNLVLWNERDYGFDHIVRSVALVMIT